MSDFKVETKCLHSGYTPSKGEPCALPIYQSTTYKYDTTDEMGQLSIPAFRIRQMTP